MSSAVLARARDFQYLLRMMNTNVDGKQKGSFALLSCKIAQVDTNRRAGDLTEEEINKISDIFAKPTDYGIPKWFLNRQRCIKDGSWSQVYSNMVATRLREDLERMKKIRNHRGLRHFWNLKVKGQRTKSTGRTGKTLGVTRKK